MRRVIVELIFDHEPKGRKWFNKETLAMLLYTQAATTPKMVKIVSIQVVEESGKKPTVAKKVTAKNTAGIIEIAKKKPPSQRKIDAILNGQHYQDL